jgi:hypothetical protein
MRYLHSSSNTFNFESIQAVNVFNLQVPIPLRLLQPLLLHFENQIHFILIVWMLFCNSITIKSTVYHNNDECSYCRSVGTY